ncbi:MAG: orotate phosphoribosyltransferase [Actinomycetota bacterium]|nr:orotate phosphoribosyltransferase [Actinomycetota bacterium]
MTTSLDPRRGEAVGPTHTTALRLAAAPRVIRTGIGTWDGAMKLPLKPLSMESAYGDPQLLHALGFEVALAARRLNADVIVGGESAGIPLAEAGGFVGNQPFAFVRKPSYVGHEQDEPRIRGATVSGRRVAFVDDAVWEGKAIEGFATSLEEAKAEVVGVFCLVDMRDVAAAVTPTARDLPTTSISGYLELLRLATAAGVLKPHWHALALDAIVHSWPDTDPRWAELEQAS